MKFSKSLLCLALALSLLAGCAGAFAEESGFPLVNEPITFTAFTPWVEHMSDPATNTMNVTYEEMTGVHIDWIQSQDYTTDLNLMIAGEQDVDLWLIPFFHLAGADDGGRGQAAAAERPDRSVCAPH